MVLQRKIQEGGQGIEPMIGSGGQQPPADAASAYVLPTRGPIDAVIPQTSTQNTEIEGGVVGAEDTAIKQGLQDLP